MEPVAKFASPDGTRIVTVYRRPDGLYEYRELMLTARSEDGWQPVPSSGLFVTLGDAEAAAHAAANA